MPEQTPSSAALTQFLEFCVGQQHYCVEILRVREVRMLDAITPLAQSPSYIGGLINLRGEIVPVIDLPIRFMRADGLPVEGSAPASAAIALIAEVRGELTAFRVDRIMDVLVSDSAQIQPVPKAISREEADYLVGMLNFDGRMILLLDIERLVPEFESPIQQSSQRREAAATLE
jgi:purine-binding chemotaxis protein CheW